MSTQLIETDRLIRTFLKIRDKRSANKRAFEAEDSDLKQKQRMVENELLRRSQEQKIKTFSTEEGTAYRAIDRHVSIADPDTFRDFVNEVGDLDFFEQRPALGHIMEYQNAHDGELPPGIRMFREYRIRVRAAKKKGVSDVDRSDD